MNCKCENCGADLDDEDEMLCEECREAEEEAENDEQFLEE